MKKCPECNEPIKGRVDKKFCSDLCRNSFNNRINSDDTNFIRNINNSLRRNRRILSELNPNGTKKVHRDKMLDKGYNFDYHTSLYTTQKGVTYYFCYDYGFLPLENDFFLVVNRKNQKKD